MKAQSEIFENDNFRSLRLSGKVSKRIAAFYYWEATYDYIGDREVIWNKIIWAKMLTNE